MILPRRRFLGSSLYLLGSTLTDALATPVWKWRESLAVDVTAATGAGDAKLPGVQFIDVAQQAGLTVPNVWGRRGA